MNPKIRKMQFKDINDILEIENESFTMPWSKWIFTQELLSPGRYYIVAEVKEKIVGYAGMQWLFDEGHITNIAVRQNWRRKGIATALLSNLIEKSKALGLKFLTLEVRVSNTAAINLYKKFGFVIEGTRLRYYINPVEDGLIMTLYL
ncbi:MAG: ribosomal protein S18-alanine N-acetyltransferase [Actinobacteria bacterium]|nr:ribosomal protein S18-alanine N-acetyltransferase [Actinomycetota bacterium]